MLTIRKYGARGFTLTELLVVLVINLLLFSALITLYLANLNHYRKTLDNMRLNQQLQSVLILMSNDIRRAGYWANASTDIGTNQNNNPFMTSSTNISVNAGADCILFSYDKNSDGLFPAINPAIDDEQYGYRLNNQVLQARPPGAPFSCTASASSWENMTNTSNIQITNLTFTLTTSTITTGPGIKGIIMRSVDVSITGRLASDNSITKTLTQHIRIRNDQFIP